MNAELLELERQRGLLARAKKQHETEIQILSLRAFTNWPRGKAVKAVKQGRERLRDMENVIRLLAMGWSYRQALKFERRGIAPQMLNILGASPYSKAKK